MNKGGALNRKHVRGLEIHSELNRSLTVERRVLGGSRGISSLAEGKIFLDSTLDANLSK